MALLTTPWNPGEIYGIALQWQRMQQAKKEAQDRLAASTLNSNLQHAQRAHEFDAKLGFDQAKLAEDARRYDAENAPFTLPGGSSPSSSVPDPQTSTPDAPPAAPEPAPQLPAFNNMVAKPAGRVDAGIGVAGATPVNILASRPSEGFNFSTTLGPAHVAEGAAGPLERTETASLPFRQSAAEAIPTPPAVQPDSATAPTLPTGKHDSASSLPLLPDELPNLLRQTGNTLAAAHMSRKDAAHVIRATAAAGASAIAQRKPATAAAGNSNPDVGSWLVNDKGYFFNPAHPEQQFEARYTEKGATYKQVKETDPWYGFKPAGEGLYEDKNGGQYFVDQITNGKPTLKRVEQDDTVQHTATDAEGRIHSYNRFGKENAVTDPATSFLKPNFKLMTGSDGNVYSFSDQGVPAKPVPKGVTFDSATNRKVSKWSVGSDGKMYGFLPDGSPTVDIPDGVRFDKSKDTGAVSHYQVDQKSGNLVGFNFKGEKIAESEGDFARIAAKTGETGKQSMTEDTTYETLAPKVKGLLGVYDMIAKTGLSPHAPHAELVERLPETGAMLSQARQQAQQAVNGLTIRGKKVGADFAEGFVRAYEARRVAQGNAPTATPPPAPPAAAPAAAPSATPAPAGKTIWRTDKNGVTWEWDEGKKAWTGKYIKAPAATAQTGAQ